MFSANVTTDFRYNTNGTSKDVLVYLKKAYLQAKLSPAFIVRAGEADLPWVPFEEGLYGYRFVENVLIDRTKFGTSTDWGVHVLGTFETHNLVSYQVSAINGAGYKNLSRSTNTIDLEGRVSVNPVKGVTVATGGYTGKLGKSNDTVNVHNRAERFNLLAAYTDNKIWAGVEYFWAKNWNNITTSPQPLPPPNTPNDKSHGWSAFGSFAFNPKLAVFGRYDSLKPTDFRVSGTGGEEVKDNYFNVGLDYKPIGPIDLALVYKREKNQERVPLDIERDDRRPRSRYLRRVRPVWDNSSSDPPGDHSDSGPNVAADDQFATEGPMATWDPTANARLSMLLMSRHSSLSAALSASPTLLRESCWSGHPGPRRAACDPTSAGARTHSRSPLRRRGRHRHRRDRQVVATPHSTAG